MQNKQRFTFLIRPDERLALRRLAEETARSQGAILRLLIRQASREQEKSPAGKPHRGGV